MHHLVDLYDPLGIFIGFWLTNPIDAADIGWALCCPCFVGVY